MQLGLLEHVTELTEVSPQANQTTKEEKMIQVLGFALPQLFCANWPLKHILFGCPDQNVLRWMFS